MTAVMPDTTTESYRVGLGDTAMLRRNSTPGRRLSSPALRELVTRLVDAESSAARLRDHACEELFDLASLVDHADRAVVLTLKRAIFNGRDVENLPAAAFGLAGVRAWFEAHRQMRETRDTIVSSYDHCLAEERQLLADAIGDDAFRLSLALNSAQVLDAVGRYRRTGGAPSARERKSERGIVQHLTRAFLRVSPLARLTGVGFATWDDEAPRLDDARLQQLPAHSRVRLDRALLSNVVTGVACLPDSGVVPTVVRRNPALRIDGDRVRLQYWTPQARRILFTPLSPEIDALLAVTSMGPVTDDAAARALTVRLAIPLDDARRLVEGGCRMQILLPGPVYDEQDDDPVAIASAVIARAGVDIDFGRLGGRALDAIAGGGVEQRVDALRDVKAIETQLNAVSSCPSRLQVNEDYLLAVRHVSPAGYEKALDDLVDVAAFHRVFDRHHEVRCLLVRAFTDLYGAGSAVNLVNCADALVDAVYAREQSLRIANAAELGPSDGTLVDLLRLRADVNAELASRIDGCGAASELGLDPAWMRAAESRLPDRFRVSASCALLVQAVDDRLVLNGCYNGHGLIGSRFGQADTELGSAGADAVRRNRERIQRLYGDAARLVEDRGLHGSNINYHQQVMPDSISPDDWLTLRLVHDPATDCLRVLDPNDREVRVVSMGMKWLELQPNPLRVAAWLYDSGRVSIDPVSRARNAGKGETSTSTVSYPRLIAGQVVMQRRRWYTGADFPVGTGGSDMSQLVEVNRWRAMHDVPDEVVVKTRLGSPTAALFGDAVDDFALSRRRDKPQYVDFASALMVRVLPKLLERRGSGYIEEALPGVRDGVKASEWAIEVDFDRRRAAPAARDRARETSRP